MDATDQASRKRQKLQDYDDDDDDDDDVSNYDVDDDDEEEEEEEEEIVPPSLDDRLSRLPDSVLLHILSFLETKLSVATSVLARRWRFLWKDVPSLDFGMKFEHPDKLRFAMIINRVMLLHNSRNINTFRFWCCKRDFDEHFNDFDLDTWLRTAIARNVRVLDLAFEAQYLPTCVYTCKTLVELTLCGFKLQGGAVCLPHLRKLRLSDVYFDSNETTLSDLIYGCPVLEELTIDDYYPRIYPLLRGRISSTTIKRLILVFQASQYEEETDNSPRELEINIPGLRYLHFKQNEETIFEHFTAVTLKYIVEANVWFGNSRVGDDVLYSQSVIHFVERLCQVKSLRLSSQFTKFLAADFAAATSRFHRLTKLELAADWRFLTKFLECADNLEVLIINKANKWKVDHEIKCWMEPKHVPTCLSSRLRQVQINPFECLEDEFNMVSYILGNAKVLKTMKICVEHLGNDSKVELDALKRISVFERASKTCKIEFY